MLKILLCLLFINQVSAKEIFSKEYLKQVSTLRDKALTDTTAYDITESLTSEVGARLSGSEGDAKAVKWAIAKFKELNFDKVYTEPVIINKWVRGVETAEIISPYPHQIKITALGGSNPTPKKGITGEIVHFKSLQELKDADASLVKGKITFISDKMERTRNGSGYGKVNGGRYYAGSITAEKGGIGAIIRSIGTDNNRDPHTGGMKAVDTNKETGEMRFLSKDEVVPTGAISNPDADLLVNIIKRGNPVKFKYTLGGHWDGEYTSYNVIGEITGREKPDEVVVIGGHLDSWDLGTGAIDDGAGCGITMAAAKLIKDAGIQPYRTIRVILWANEEMGLSGAKTYAKNQSNNMKNHIIGAESDFGAGSIYAIESNVSEHALPVVAKIAELLKPLGIGYGGNNGGAAPDITPLKAAGMATFKLSQDGTKYFDLHHTQDDTMDKIVPEEIAQNVAVWIVFVALAAEYTGNFGFDLIDTDKT